MLKEKLSVKYSDLLDSNKSTQLYFNLKRKNNKVNRALSSSRK